MALNKKLEGKKNTHKAKKGKKFFNYLRLNAAIFGILFGIIILSVMGCGTASLETWVSHPLDYMTPMQGPSQTSLKEINLAMMKGEWRAAVFNLTNYSDGSKQIRFSIKGLPDGDNPEYISVYEVQWTYTKDQTPIGAALKPIPYSMPGYSTVVPSGMTIQIWLSFHPIDVMAGNYNGEILIDDSDDDTLTVPLNFFLFPIDFPKNVTLHVGGWDYTDYDFSGVTDMNREALISHLQEHFVDSPWAQRVMPFGSFDSQGNCISKPDTLLFDNWVEHWPNARRYCVFLNVGDSIAGSKIGSEEFDAKVKSWIDYWVEHALAKGIKPDQLLLLLVDEPHENDQDQKIILWAKAIHEAQPKVMIWEDPIYSNPEDAINEMISSVNVLCPKRIQVLREDKNFEDFYQKQKAEGRHLDLYSCEGNMLLLDPYSYIRLQAWTCWKIGAESTLFWSFSDTHGQDPWSRSFDSNEYFSPLFLTADSVTPGKHMEALRESAEDFEYFVMLKDAVSKSEPSNPALLKAQELLQTGADRVLKAANADQLEWESDKNRWVAEDVRMEILESLVKLGYAGEE
jgi:hypothetical protein